MQINKNMIKKRIKVKVLEGSPFLISQEELIGQGSFGKVVRAYKKDEPMKQLVAKIIPISTENIQSIQTEVKILKTIPHHQNLVNCLRMKISTEHNFYLIMQYCNGGSFERYIENNRNCSQEIVWRFLADFCQGYEVLYDHHVVHRDIKPDNIMIHNGKFKIADFGLSRKIKHHNIIQNLSVKGTPLYMAPQLELEQKGSSKVDVFSLGIVLYRLAFNGQHPFYKHGQQFKTVKSYFESMRSTKLTFPKFPARSSDLIKLITSMLQKQPQSRLEWKSIFQHHKLKKSHNKNKQPKQMSQQTKGLTQLRRSIVQINKSSATLKDVTEPLDHKGTIDDEKQRLIQFTQYFSAKEFDSLEKYILRRKVIIQLILHLNKIINTLVLPIYKQTKKIRNYLNKIRQTGKAYCYMHLKQLGKLLQIYSMSEDASKYLFRQAEQLGIKSEIFEHLSYENKLYDFLIEYSQYSPEMQEQVKIPVALMIDIYDACLKIESMSHINEQGRIQMTDIELQDAEIERIDYSDLLTYAKYLEQINQVTVHKISLSLKRMGLLIQ